MKHATNDFFFCSRSIFWWSCDLLLDSHCRLREVYSDRLHHPTGAWRLSRKVLLEEIQTWSAASLQYRVQQKGLRTSQVRPRPGDCQWVLLRRLSLQVLPCEAPARPLQPIRQRRLWLLCLAQAVSYGSGDATKSHMFCALWVRWLPRFGFTGKRGRAQQTAQQRSCCSLRETCQEVTATTIQACQEACKVNTAFLKQEALLRATTFSKENYL